MKVVTIILFGLFLFFASLKVFYGQNIKAYESFDAYAHLLNKKNDTTYVINFWATWCAPCVKEMPAFVKLQETYEDQKLKIILTSMDFGRNVDQRVNAFIEKHNISSKVVILDDPDSNSWIGKVNPKWTGGIPATLIYNKKKRLFFEREFSFQEINDIIKSKFNIP